MITRLIHSQTKTIFGAAFLLGITIFASRILGLVRDRILAGRYGAGETLDIYYAAFQIPDLLYTILIMGAVSSALLPVFTEYMHRDRKEAWELVNQVLNFFLFSLIALGAILALASPWLVRIIAPGFTGATYETAVRVTQIMFISPVLFGVSNIVGVILQFSRRFFIYSVAPLFYNAGIIIGAIFFAPIWGVYGLAYGVILGSLFHMAVQIPSAFLSGLRFRPTLQLFSGGVRKILFLMLPRSFGLAVSQLSILAFTALASLISSGAITVFQFANNIAHIPVGILGISFAVAAFPSFSKLAAQNNKEEFTKEFFSAFRMIVFITAPLAALLFFLRAHIVRVLLGTGNFGWTDTRLTAAVLGTLAFGIVFSALIPLCTRAFFARQNTKTPVLINIASTVMSIVFAILFFAWFRSSPEEALYLFRIFDVEDLSARSVIALPLGISLGAAMNFFLLLLGISMSERKPFSYFSRYVLGMMGIALLSGFLGYVVLNVSREWFDESSFFGIVMHGSLGGIVAVAVYFFIAWVLGIEETRRIRSIPYKLLKIS